jgi:hypothetical protein
MEEIRIGGNLTPDAPEDKPSDVPECVSGAKPFHRNHEYRIGPHAVGTQDVSIFCSALEEMIAPRGPLRSLLL